MLEVHATLQNIVFARVASLRFIINTKANVAKTFFLLLICIGFCGCKSNAESRAARYVTWNGLEPDKWASVWLIKRHIDSDAEVVLRPVGAPIANGIAFGVPEAEFRRSHGISVYESLRQNFHLDDPVLIEISRIMHDIEISPWTGKKSEYSTAVEQAYRTLQIHFDQRVVPADCYGRFFDVVYVLLAEDAAEIEWDQLYGLAENDSACQTDSSAFAIRDDSPFVRQLETHVVLDHIGAGNCIPNPS